jgi:hypothetical protein
VKMFSVFSLREVDVEEGAVRVVLVGDAFDVVAVALAFAVEGVGCAVGAGILLLLDDTAVSSDRTPVPVEALAGNCLACARCCRRLRPSTSRGSSTVWN